MAQTAPVTGYLIRHRHITRQLVRRRHNCLFIFGDNMLRRGLGGQAAEMRGEPNAIGVPTKTRPSRHPAAYFSDDDFDRTDVRAAIEQPFRTMRETIAAGRHVVIPADGLGTGLADLPARAPRIYALIEGRIAELLQPANTPHLER